MANNDSPSSGQTSKSDPPDQADATPTAANEVEVATAPDSEDAPPTGATSSPFFKLLPHPGRAPMPREAKIAFALLALIVAGFALGIAIFRRPKLPSFGHEIKSSGTPVEAAGTPEAAPAADPDTLPASHDALQGEWVVDLGERGLLRVDLTDRAAASITYQGAPLQLYAVESNGLPPLWAMPAKPGDLLLFFDGSGEARQRYEQVEVHEADLFSFREPATGRRRYAHRSGTLPRATAEVAGEETIELTPVPGIAPPAGAIEALWQQAERQRDDDDYYGLLATLDQIERVDGGDSRLTRWRRQAERGLADLRAEAYEDVKDQLRELASAIEDRDLRRLRRLWGGTLDGETSRYFTQLFRRHRELRVEIRLLSVVIEDRRAVACDTQIVLGTKIRRGRILEREVLPWHAELDQDGNFTSPLP